MRSGRVGADRCRRHRLVRQVRPTSVCLSVPSPPSAKPRHPAVFPRAPTGGPPDQTTRPMGSPQRCPPPPHNHTGRQTAPPPTRRSTAAGSGRDARQALAAPDWYPSFLASGSLLYKCCDGFLDRCLKLFVLFDRLFVAGFFRLSTVQVLIDFREIVQQRGHRGRHFGFLFRVVHFVDHLLGGNQHGADVVQRIVGRVDVTGGEVFVDFPGQGFDFCGRFPKRLEIVVVIAMGVVVLAVIMVPVIVVAVIVITMLVITMLVITVLVIAVLVIAAGGVCCGDSAAVFGRRAAAACGKGERKGGQQSEGQLQGVELHHGVPMGERRTWCAAPHHWGYCFRLLRRRSDSFIKIFRSRMFSGVTSTNSSSSMYSKAVSSDMSRGGFKITFSSLPAARMLVSFFSRQGLTVMSLSRAFSPTIMPS